MRRTRSRAAGAAAVLVTATLALTACSGPAATGVDAVPAARSTDLQLVTDGVLTVGVDATYPPMEYREGGELKGSNIELVSDIARRLGLEVRFVDVAFADLRPAAAAHRIDMTGVAMTDTAARQADVDFVDYFVGGAQVLVGADGEDLTAPSSWCGKRGATTGGTTDSDILLAQSRLCEEAGQDPITFVDVPYTKSVDELEAGRADFGLEDLPAAAFLAAGSEGRIRVLGDQLQPQPYGYGFAKDRTALRDAVQRALQDAIADGTYDAILEDHQIAPGALKSTSVNGGA